MDSEVRASSQEQKYIPDTLNLEERAAIAINSLTGCVDVKNGYIPYMAVNLISKPAVMVHSAWDYGSSIGRLVDALILARHMSGETLGEDIEKHLQANLLSLFKDNGLSYRQPSPLNDPNANMHDQRSVLLGLTTWFMATGDSKIKAATDKLCAALKRIALKERDFWCFPSAEYTEQGWPSRDAIFVGTIVDPAHTSARMINPLIKYYQVTGNTDAFELAENFTAHTVYHSGVFNADGSFNKGTEFRNGHFHSRTVSVAGIARFAQFTDNAFYMHWVKNVYDWILSQGTSFGWFPGALVKNKAYHHETCTLTDIIEIGIILAQSGYPQCWECVERFVRNHLVETQLLSADWVVEADNHQKDTWKETYYQVGRRSIGSFAGWAAPNDFVCEIEHSYDIMTCCRAHGTRGLFLAWDNIVTEKNGRVSVNLLLNRGTRWLDVNSYLPHEGRVDLNINQDIRQLLVRIPSWVAFDAVKVSRKHNDNDGMRKPVESWIGPFAKLGSSRKGEEITIAFPLRRCETTEKAWDQQFVAEWQGDDVIFITPPGKYYPLYTNRKIYKKAPKKIGDYHRIQDEFRW